MTTKHENKEIGEKSKDKELKALGFIIVVLFPALSIAAVGSYGLVIWMIQAFGGVIPH
ncbi:MAG: trimethylamine N-oxide reductase system protein TorE [Cognaticolwellia sp.]